MFKRTLLLICLSLLAAPLLADSYSWSFRNSQFDNLSLVPSGSGAVNLLEPTANGLHISVPAGHAVKSVGFSPRFRISGDFEITLEFTILKWSQPESGYGSGPSIYLSLGSTKAAAASLGRKLRPDGRDIYGVFAARIEDDRRIPSAKLFEVPEGTKSAGKLRLKRTEKMVTYSVADDLFAPFREIATLPVGDSDVTMLRVGLEQSDPQSSAEVVLHHIEIKADELPQLPSEQSRTAQLYRPRYLPSEEPVSYRWIWQSLIALVIASGFIVWLWKRYR